MGSDAKPTIYSLNLSFSTNFEKSFTKLRATYHCNQYYNPIIYSPTRPIAGSYMVLKKKTADCLGMYLFYSNWARGIKKSSSALEMYDTLIQVINFLSWEHYFFPPCLSPPPNPLPKKLKKKKNIWKVI